MVHRVLHLLQYQVSKLEKNNSLQYIVIKQPLICSTSLLSAQKVSPFYEEWWFLVVIALVGLIFILLLVFILIIRGQSKKYTKKTDSGGSIGQ